MSGTSTNSPHNQIATSTSSHTRVTAWLALPMDSTQWSHRFATRVYNLENVVIRSSHVFGKKFARGEGRISKKKGPQLSAPRAWQEAPKAKLESRIRQGPTSQGRRSDDRRGASPRAGKRKTSRESSATAHGPSSRVPRVPI